jgi:DNA-binding IclR family transcriptional regulator
MLEGVDISRQSPPYARSATSPTNGAPGPSGADRVLVGLKLLAGFPEGVTLDEFARVLKTPKPTAHRVLATLRRAGLAQQDAAGRYHLALEYVRLAFEYYDHLDVRDVVDPAIRRLADHFGEAAYYASLDGADVIYLARAATPGRVQTTRTVGERQPAHSTASGKVLLAHQLVDQASVRAYVARYGPLERLTTMTLVTVGELHHELELTRERGYAVDREENEVGVACLAVPVYLDLPTNPTGSISVAAIAQRTPIDALIAQIDAIVSLVRQELGPEAIRRGRA